MDKKKKEKKYIFGIIGGFIHSLVFFYINDSSIYLYRFIGILGA